MADYEVSLKLQKKAQYLYLPLFCSVEPADCYAYVLIDTPVKLTFSKAMDCDSVKSALRSVSLQLQKMTVTSR